MLDDYRQLVKNYDAAVQYCLQPVEMIFGADKAGLDQLVKHVEEARRRLFLARVELEKSTILSDSKATGARRPWCRACAAWPAPRARGWRRWICPSSSIPCST